ncbi:AGE family epimerase/isomerase [Sporolactobacillus sp. THM7-7]|nr:AGE family epimerase/isomerase [Sporolactobacillus sp. THM7-7]
MNTLSFKTSEFFHPDWLRSHIFQTINFYYPQSIDHQTGGYFHCFLDDGSVCDIRNKDLVGTARFIYIYSVGTLLGGPSDWRRAVEHGLHFLEHHFRDPVYGGYYWRLKGKIAADPTKYAYGHAFVLLAVSYAARAGISCARRWIEEIYQILETHFRDKPYGLYLDERSFDWSRISPYRGQNANMHLCEAMIAAFEATGHPVYLRRAYQLAYAVTVILAGKTGGMIWEQYDERWNPDWRYHQEYEGNEFRPYGFLPGHALEWSKLLLKLSAYCPEPWIVQRAEALYYGALNMGTDTVYGGLFFSIAPDGYVLDSDKYYWVMAEAIGASALMAAKSRRPSDLRTYQSFFEYCRNYFIDHKYGGWYPRLNRRNKRIGRIKSPPPKTDYHPIANCLQALFAFSYTPVKSISKN